MSVLTNLLRCYEYSEKEGLVGEYNGNDAVLLPLYHQSITSKKNNVLKVTLDEEGQLLNAEFAADGEVYLFPITEDSVARSSGVAPHPLEDKMQYCISKIADKKKFEAYRKEFDNFYDYAEHPKVKLFLNAVKLFLSNEKNYALILSKLPLKDIVETGKGKIKYTGEKNKKTEYDFKDTFVCFEVRCHNGSCLKVNTFSEMQEEFVSYIDDRYEREGTLSICNISGTKETITEKHRGLMGTAKVISVSNNKETYFGRFHNGSDIIRVGRKSSEKIHLMLKFLLENRNSHIHLADTLFLVNWFSGDIKNTIAFDLTGSDMDDDMEEEGKNPVSESNKEISRAFIRGTGKLNPEEQYYIMLVDKSSNGRMSIRYYKEMPNSQLIENLQSWQKKYIWEQWKQAKETYVEYVPSLHYILLASYGIERNKILVIDDGKFEKDQFQNLVTALVEGKSVPSNIKNALAQNIRNRQKYSETWRFMLLVSLAILSEGRKEYQEMREESHQTRSYLYGRLLAIYEGLEEAVLRDQQRSSLASSDDSSKKSKIRATNALRYWNSFVNKPDTTMKTLELATKYCASYILSSNKPDYLVGVLIKTEKAKSEIFELLDTQENRKYKTNTQLDNDFIFGYYAQKKDLYTKKENDDE